jgi:hypothetical protein
LIIAGDEPRFKEEDLTETAVNKQGESNSELNQVFTVHM